METGTSSAIHFVEYIYIYIYMEAFRLMIILILSSCRNYPSSLEIKLAPDKKKKIKEKKETNKITNKNIGGLWMIFEYTILGSRELLQIYPKKYVNCKSESGIDCGSNRLILIKVMHYDYDYDYA
jgi:hypothetical protein